jgi:hypothetical protein
MVASGRDWHLSARLLDDEGADAFAAVELYVTVDKVAMHLVRAREWAEVVGKALLEQVAFSRVHPFQPGVAYRFRVGCF